MQIKQVGVSEQARSKLIRLKTKTGIDQWNIICRWALCYSLSKSEPPSPIDVKTDSNIEMTWQVFGGENHEIYLALLKERCHVDGVPVTLDSLNIQMKRHLNRGIGYIADELKHGSINDLIQLALNAKQLDDD